MKKKKMKTMPWNFAKNFLQKNSEFLRFYNGVEIRWEIGVLFFL